VRFHSLELPRHIKADSTWRVGGAGIVSASVNGDAALPQFGAWKVKQIANDDVVFESTQDTRVSFITGFSITAPDSINGEIDWHFVTGPPDLSRSN
jgi:hypothetical protein